MRQRSRPAVPDNATVVENLLKLIGRRASLAGGKKYAEAEPLLLEGYEGMLARKDFIDVPDWHYLDRSRE